MQNAGQLNLQLDGVTFAEAQKALEAAYMCHVLTVTRFNMTKGARLAGMSYNAFRERVGRLNLTVAANA